MKTPIRALLRTAALIAALTLAGAGTVPAQEIDDCLACHEDRNLTKTDASGKVHSLYVDKEAFVNSVHGKSSYTCVDCHEGVQAKTHPAGGIVDVNCGSCHEEVLKEQEKSNHGQLLKEGNAYAPKCYDCHTMHSVLLADERKSSVHPDNLSITCGKCHEEEAKPSLPVLAFDFIKGKQTADSFSLVTLLAPVATRVKGHGKVNMACDFSTRRCSDCHFEAMNHGDTGLKPKVCSSCHEVDRNSFVFGKIHKAGIIQSPMLSIMLVLLYLIGIAGIVLYFKPAVRKQEEKKEEGAEVQ